MFVSLLIVGYFAIKVILYGAKKSIGKLNMDKTISSFLLGFLRFMLYVAYVIALLNVVGVPMTSFIALLSAVGLAVALALQGNLSNFASALVILIFKPFKVGDFIETQSSMGTVKDIQLLFTYILTPDNRKVIIPNSELVNSRVTNYTSEERRRIDLVISAAYENDVETVKSIVMGIIQNNDLVIMDPEPVVRLANHGASALEYDVKVWVAKSDYWTVRYGLMEEIKEQFDQNGIRIPYPQREVVIKS